MYGNILHFYNASSIDEISVYNALGQLLPSQFENNILFIHDDYKGVIFLKIISQNKENHFKVLKLKQVNLEPINSCNVVMILL